MKELGMYPSFRSVKGGIAVVVSLLIGMVSLAAGPVIEVGTPMSPPEWALLEREVLDAGSKAVDLFYENYFEA